ncbi:Transcription factor COE2 [Tyrophagus putrescentiae]|nr:Transcription factor COE2 [Tyrophagus putrescentiae]
MSVYAKSPVVIVYGPAPPPSPSGTVYCPPLMIAMMPQQQQPLQSRGTISTNPKDHLQQQHWGKQQHVAVDLSGQSTLFNALAVPSSWGNVNAVNAVPWMMSSSSTEKCGSGGGGGGGGGGTPFEQWQQVSSTGSPPLPLPPTPPFLSPTPSLSPSAFCFPSPMLLTSSTTPVSPVTSTPSSPAAAAATTEAADDYDDEPFPSDLPDSAANSCAQAEQNFILDDSQMLIEQQQQHLQEKEEEEEEFVEEEFVKEEKEFVEKEMKIMEEKMEIMEEEMEIMEEEIMAMPESGGRFRGPPPPAPPYDIRRLLSKRPPERAAWLLKKVLSVSSASVATAKTSGPPKLQVLERKTRAKPRGSSIGTVMKKTSVKKDGAKATEKATYVSALKSSVPPPSAQKQKTAGKGGIGSQPKMKFNQKKVSLCQLSFSGHRQNSGPPKLQVLEQKTRAKPSKTEHSKGLLTVLREDIAVEVVSWETDREQHHQQHFSYCHCQIISLKGQRKVQSFLSGLDSTLLVYGQFGSVFKHQSPRPQILPQQQPKPEEYLSLSSQSNVNQSTSSATNGHHRYQPPSNNNSSANSTFASSSSSATTTTSHSEAPTRGHRSRKQTLPQLDVSPPNPQNELPDSDDQEPAADKVPPPPSPPPTPIASTSSSSSAASAPLPPPPPQNEPMFLPPVNALTCVTFFCRHCRRLLSLPESQEAMDAHRNAYQGRQTSDANTGISRFPRYLPNALAASGVKRANDGTGMAGKMALAVEVGAGVGSGDSGSERAAKRQARLEETRLKKMLELEPKRLEELHHAIQMRTRNSGGGERASAAVEETPNDHQQQNNDQHMEEDDEDVVGDADNQYDNDEGYGNAEAVDQEFMEEEKEAVWPMFSAIQRKPTSWLCKPSSSSQIASTRSISSSSSSFPTKEQFSTVVTLTLLVVDAATKAVVRYEGGDKNVDLQRVLLTHSAICSRCSLCGNEKDSLSAPRLDESRITGGTSLTFFLRCNQNCFKQAAAVNSFLGVSTKAGKLSPSSLSSLTIEALTCRRRKFQLAVIVGVGGSGSNDEVAPVAYFSFEFFVHNSSKMLRGDGRSSSFASTVHSPSSSPSPSLLPARKKVCTAEKKKKQSKKEEESSNFAEEEVGVRTPESYHHQQQKPSFAIAALNPAQGPPGTELHLLVLFRHLFEGISSSDNLDSSKSFWSSLEVKLFLKGWQLPLTTPQLLLPTALPPNALKVTLPPKLASLVSPNLMLTVALVDRATGATAHCPVPFQLLEEKINSRRSSSLFSSSSSSLSGVSEEEEFLLSRLNQLLPKRSALMEGGRYSASFDGSKQTSSSLSSPSPSSSSPSVSSHEIFERAALFLDWYHGQPSLPAPNMLQIFTLEYEHTNAQLAFMSIEVKPKDGFHFNAGGTGKVVLKNTSATGRVAVKLLTIELYQTTSAVCSTKDRRKRRRGCWSTEKEKKVLPVSSASVATAKVSRTPKLQVLEQKTAKPSKTEHSKGLLTKFTSLSKEDYAGKGGIGSQPKMKSNQKKMPLVSSASVATANIFWTTEAASSRAKDLRQTQKKIEHSKGLLTVSAKMSPLKSIASPAALLPAKKTVSKGKEKSKGAVVAGRHLGSAQKVPPCPKWALLLFRALTLKKPNCRPFQRGFRGEQHAFRKPQVALKAINISNLTSEEREVDLPKELTALIKVKHRFVVLVYDIFRHREHVFIFIELADGGDLAIYRWHHRPLREALVASWFEEVAEALAYLHFTSTFSYHHLRQT